MSVVAGPVDGLVEAMLLEALPNRAFEQAQQSEPEVNVHEVQAAMERIQLDMELATLDWTAGRMPYHLYALARDDLQAQLAASEALLPQSRTRNALAGLPVASDPLALRAAWDMWDLERRRAVLTAVIDRVTVAPATYRGRPTFDRDRISVTWRV